MEAAKNPYLSKKYQECIAAKALSTYFSEVVWCMYGPTQVKCQLLFSSIFDALNFHHFLEVLEIIFYSISEKC